MDNTPNYAQQIEEARRKQTAIAGQQQSMIEAQPELTAQARQSYYADPTLKALQQNFSSKVLELYNYDKMKAAGGQPSMTTQGGYEMPVNPMIAERGAMNAYEQILKQKEDAWQMYEDRKNLIGNELDKAVKIYESKIKLKESERQALKDEIDTLQSAWAQTSLDQSRADENALRLAELEAKRRGTPVTGDEQIDSMSNEEAVALAESQLGLKVAGGTLEERGAKAKMALGDASKGTLSYSRYLNNLPVAEQSKLSALADVIQRANDITIGIQGQTAISGPIVGRTSKFMADIFGKTGAASMYGKELEEMSADKIKERYGGALTTTEVSRLTKQAITSRNIQETSNIESLAIMKKNATSLITEKLRASGWTDKAINQYLTEIGAGDIGQSRPSLQQLLGE